MADILTIRETVQRAKAEDVPISEYTLRQWVRSGAVPVRKVGKKALIFYPNLLKYLQCEETTPATVADKTERRSENGIFQVL